MSNVFEIVFWRGVCVKLIQIWVFLYGDAMWFQSSFLWEKFLSNWLIMCLERSESVHVKGYHKIIWTSLMLFSSRLILYFTDTLSSVCLLQSLLWFHSLVCFWKIEISLEVNGFLLWSIQMSHKCVLRNVIVSFKTFLVSAIDVLRCIMFNFYVIIMKTCFWIFWRKNGIYYVQLYFF